MSEAVKTSVYVGIAVVLAVIAWGSIPRPKTQSLDEKVGVWLGRCNHLVERIKLLVVREKPAHRRMELETPGAGLDKALGLLYRLFAPPWIHIGKWNNDVAVFGCFFQHFVITHTLASSTLRLCIYAEEHTGHLSLSN